MSQHAPFGRGIRTPRGILMKPVEEIRAHLRELTQLLEALPAAAPGLTSLRTSQQLPALDETDDVNWQDVWADERGVVQAAGRISSLVELQLGAPGFEPYPNCVGLWLRTGLRSLRIDVMSLCDAYNDNLPPGLTSLHVEGLEILEELGDSWFCRDSWMEYDEESWWQDDDEEDEAQQEAQSQEQQQQQQQQQGGQQQDGQQQGGQQQGGQVAQQQQGQEQARRQRPPLYPGNPWGNWWLRNKLLCQLPQLQSLHLGMDIDPADLHSSELDEGSGYADRFLALARMQPALMQVTHLAFAVPALVMNPDADKSLPLWRWQGRKDTPTDDGLKPGMKNCRVLSQLTTLHSLVLGEPWRGMARHLAPLVRLTSLSFVGVGQGSRGALSEAQLGQVAKAAEQLAGLARLAARLPGGRWPDGLAARVRHALPGCSLCEV
jgi:hypothetical protein